MCHSGRRGRARKIRSTTNVYACMITDLPSPPQKQSLLKNHTHVKHTADTRGVGSQRIRAKRAEHGVENNRKWKFVFSTALSTSLPSQALFPLQWLFAAPSSSSSHHRHTHTHTHSTSRSVTGQGDVQCV